MSSHSSHNKVAGKSSITVTTTSSTATRSTHAGMTSSDEEEPGEQKQQQQQSSSGRSHPPRKANNSNSKSTMVSSANQQQQQQQPPGERERDDVAEESSQSPPQPASSSSSPSSVMAALASQSNSSSSSSRSLALTTANNKNKQRKSPVVVVSERTTCPQQQQQPAAVLERSEKEDDTDEDACAPPPALKYASSSSPLVGGFAAAASLPRTTTTAIATISKGDEKDAAAAAPPPPPPQLSRHSPCSSSLNVPSWYSNRNLAEHTNTNNNTQQRQPQEPEDESDVAAAAAAPPSLVRHQSSSGVVAAGVASPENSRNGKRTDTAATATTTRRRRRPEQQQQQHKHTPIDVDAYMGGDSDDDDDDDLDDLPKLAAATSTSPPPPPPSLIHAKGSGEAKIRASVSESQRLPSTRQSFQTKSAANSDEKAPPLDEPPVVRTPSQEAAVAAVLGEDDSNNDNSDLALKKSILATAELADEELGAAITPELRRHSDSNSTPGAFRAGGRGSGVARASSRDDNDYPPSSEFVEHLPESPSRNNSLASTTQAQQELHSVDDSCTTLVSATLVTTVGDSYTETETATQNKSNTTNSSKPGPEPVLAHAVPLWKKRRIVLCLSLWALAAVAVVAACASLALVASGVIGNGSGSDDKDDDDDDLDGDLRPSSDDVLTLSPTETPQNGTDPSDGNQEQIVSSHAVSWGKISTCDDPDFFSHPDNDLQLRCGGKLEPVLTENAECEPVPFQGFPEIFDTARLSCRLTVGSSGSNAPGVTDGGDFYQEALGLVVFNCVGESEVDRTATATLPAVTVHNCTTAPRPDDNDNEDNNGARRLQVTTTATAPRESLHQQHLHGKVRPSRALQEIQVHGGASAFISMGRYCQEPSGGEWLLWHEMYSCEAGDRVAITPVGDLYDPGDDPLGSTESGGGGGGGGGGSNIWSDIVDQIFGGGGRRHRRRQLGRPQQQQQQQQQPQQHRDLQFDEVLDPLYKLADLDVFCYQLENCADEDHIDGAGGCTFEIPPLRMSNADSRSLCASFENDGPLNEEMRSAAHDEFHPHKFIDRMAGDL